MGGARGLRAVGERRAMKLKRQGDAREFEVELLAPNKQSKQTKSDQPDDGHADSRRAVRISIDGREIVAMVATLPDGSAMVDLDGRRVRVAGARRRSSIVAGAGPPPARVGGG